jgi:hypothetical protein
LKLLPELVLVISALMFHSGCFLVLGAGAGAGGYYYVEGEMKRTYGAELDASWTAVRQALADLSLEVAKEQKDGLGGFIEARRADDTQVVIKLDPISKGTTRIRVRVGMFGDRKASEAIFERISFGLKG